MMMTSTAVANYSFIAITFHFPANRRQLLMCNGYVLAVFLPFYCGTEQLENERLSKNDEKFLYGLTRLMAVALKKEVRMAADYVRGERRMREAH